MRVLVGCEFSGTVRDAFLALGHDATSCDLEPSETPGPHYRGDVRDILGDGWDLLIGHPDCRYLCRAGQWCLTKPDDDGSTGGALKGEPRWAALREAAAFFLELRNAPIPRIAIENPRPSNEAAALIGWPDQVVHPWEHGHGEVKATGLWLTGLPPLMPTDLHAGRVGRVANISPGPDRYRERSRTFPGIAAAMASQWGGTP